MPFFGVIVKMGAIFDYYARFFYFQATWKYKKDGFNHKNRPFFNKNLNYKTQRTSTNNKADTPVTPDAISAISAE